MIYATVSSSIPSDHPITCKINMLSFQDDHVITSFLSNPFLIFLVTSFSIWLLSKFPYKHRIQMNLPPSPPKLPILGNLHQLTELTHRSFQSLGQKYGPVMLLHFGKKPVIIVQSSDASKEVMKTHDLIFATKPGTKATRRIFYDLKDISVPPYGEYWRKMKSICVIQLLSSRRVQSFSSIRREETALLMRKIESCRSRVNLSQLLMEFTNDVICRSAFGRKYSEGEDGRRYLMLLKESTQLMGSISIGEFVPCLSWINRLNGFDQRLDKAAKEIDDFLERVLEERMKEGGESLTDAVKDESRGNLVDILLGIYKENAAGVSMDRDSIKAIILDIVIGGTDTGHAALEWAMTELLRNPIVMKKLQTEVRGIMHGKHDITDAELEQMHYLKAVIKETLRYHPPIPVVARMSSEDTKLMGYDIAERTMLIINSWAVGSDPVSWNEPEKFEPERFLNSNIDFNGLDFELIPFGAGRRRCPGIAFAIAGIELVLANLVHKFEWELTDGMKQGELDDVEDPGITIHRKNPLLAVASSI